MFAERKCCQVFAYESETFHRDHFPLWKWRTKPPKPPIPFGRRGPPTNTAMYRPIVRTTPNRSSDGWGTVAHVRRKILIRYNGAPQIRPKSIPSRRPVSKPHHLPHPWTRPTYDAKRHPDPIRRFSIMHWIDRPTNARTYVRTDKMTDRPRESLTTIGRCAPRATRPNNNTTFV